MKHKNLLFALLFVGCINFYNTVNAQVNEKDSLALVDLYKFTNRKNWTFNSGWLTSAPVSTWTGVTVSGNRVTNLSLSFNKLKGVLPPTIGNLTAVRSLDLAFNSLTGIIPPTIGRMKALEDLEL